MMTIDEAIETLENDQRRNYTQVQAPLYKAQGLGIEALKAIEKYRNHLWFILELPSETEKKRQ